jgi:hypothetical protein
MRCIHVRFDVTLKLQVPSANAPGSLGLLVPLTVAQTLTEEQSMQRSRKEIKRWKDDQSALVQEKIIDLEARMSRLSTLDDRFKDARLVKGDDRCTWSVVLPGIMPEKIETETQKFLVAKQASSTMRRIVTGDLEMPPSPFGYEGDNDNYAEAESVPVPTASMKHLSKAQNQDEVHEIEFGWCPADRADRVSESPDGIRDHGDDAYGNGHGGEGHKDRGLNKRAEIKVDVIEDFDEVTCSLLCGGFSHKSITRNICFAIYSSQHAKAFFMTVWMANIVFIAVSPPMNRLSFNQWQTVADLIALGFNAFSVLIFFIEVSAGLVALGPAWLNVSIYHSIDLFLLFFCVLEVVGSALNVRMPTLRPLRVLRIFQTTSWTKVLKDFDIIILTLEKCRGQIVTIALICAFYFAFFSIIGMAVYQKSFRRACVMVDHPVPSCASDFNTSWNNECIDQDFIGQTWHASDGGKLYVSARCGKCVSKPQSENA